MKTEKIAFFSAWKKQLVRENEDMIPKESEGPRDTEMPVCQGSLRPPSSCYAHRCSCGALQLKDPS